MREDSTQIVAEAGEKKDEYMLAAFNPQAKYVMVYCDNFSMFPMLKQQLLIISDYHSG